MHDPLTEYFSGVLPREPMPLTAGLRLPSMEELDAYAVQQWEVWFNLHLNSIISGGDLGIVIYSPIIMSNELAYLLLVLLLQWAVNILAAVFTNYFGNTVFFAASHMFQWCWKGNKHQLFHDESFPTWPFESEVLFLLLWFKTFSTSLIKYFNIWLILACLLAETTKNFQDWLRVAFNSW